jgi:hypothetical protein
MNQLHPDSSYESYCKHLPEISAITNQMKTKIKRVYDRYALQSYHQLAIADEIYDYFTHKWGLQLQIENLYNFGYTFADHWDRHGYYVFVVNNQKLLITKWVAHRKQIGDMLHKYKTFDLIVFYPKSEQFRFYLQCVKYYEKTIPMLGHFERVSEHRFIQKQRYL